MCNKMLIRATSIQERIVTHEFEIEKSQKDALKAIETASSVFLYENKNDKRSGNR